MSSDRESRRREGGQGEFSTSDSGPKTGFWSGPNFVNAKVEYIVVNGWAIAEGDICLGTEEELKNSNDPKYLDRKVAEEQAREAEIDISGLPTRAGVIKDTRYRWPNCTMYYEIDPNLPNQARVIDAMKHWTEKTGFKFVKRTTEPDYVYFTDQGGCWSMIGRRGGKQIISLGSGCSTGNAIHEIGHALGLFHEQSRNDRDTYVRINWANIDPQYQSNFSQYLNSGVDIGQYDYCSIMHYPPKAFSTNGQDTITALKPGAECMGQRTGLSPHDIAAIAQIYPECRPIDRCLIYALQARRAYKMYTSTKIRRYLCLFYLYMARYYCCRYAQTRNPQYLLLCRRYRMAYIRCTTIVVPPRPIPTPQPIPIPIPPPIPTPPTPPTPVPSGDIGEEEATMMMMTTMEGMEEECPECPREMEEELAAMGEEAMMMEQQPPEGMLEEEMMAMEPEMMEEEELLMMGGEEAMMMMEEGLFEEEEVMMMEAPVAPLPPVPLPPPAIPQVPPRCRYYRSRALWCLNAYRRTHAKKYLCCFYLYAMRYFCCLYKYAQNPVYLQRCKYYRKLYALCVQR
ncbi:MAG: M12 family metallopeptidase [Thermoproteota archaeon]